MQKLTALFVIAIFTLPASAQSSRPPVAPPADAPEKFPLQPESQARLPGVEPGETLGFEWNDSRIFPGTQRKIRVYVPRAYDGKTPACVAVFQDGGGYRFEIVFDNLIHAGEMPVTIAVVVPPGNVPAAGAIEGARNNRTFEYDSPGDRYARFILEEILPAAERLATADGRPVRLSKNGNDRMIAGGSSGAAAAFNAAWAMPHEFPRVFSAIGSYTGLRGSYIYPTLVHKTEPKPLRLFLQSGTRDMWTSFGDWWSANNAMVRALGFAGYEFEYEFGDGKHSGAHGTALFPRAMRFLWKGWPAPVAASTSTRNHVQRAALVAGETWKALPGDFSGARNLRADRHGAVYFSRGDTHFKHTPGVAKPVRTGDGTLWAFDADGESRIVATADGAIVRVSPDGKKTQLAQGIRAASLAVAQNGAIYAGGSPANSPIGARPESLWLVRAATTAGAGASEKSAPRLLDEGLKGVTALSVTGDGNWLAAFERDTTRGASFRIERDGALSFGQTFYVLHKPDEADSTCAADSAADRSELGFQYVATNMGVQICDANGRSAAILPLPGGVAAVSLCFGGADFKTLYVLGADGRMYARPLRHQGAQPFLPPLPIKAKAG